MVKKNYYHLVLNKHVARNGDVSAYLGVEHNGRATAFYCNVSLGMNESWFKDGARYPLRVSVARDGKEIVLWVMVNGMPIEIRPHRLSRAKLPIYLEKCPSELPGSLLIRYKAICNEVFKATLYGYEAKMKVVEINS